MITIKVISDLHLTSFDTGNKTDDELIDYLDNHHTDFLILNGDIYDCLKSDTFESTRKEYDDICAMYPKFTARIKNDPTIFYIRGNHDREIKEVPKELNINFNNYTIHFEHGHRSDKFLSKCHCLECCGLKCFGQYQRSDKARADAVETLLSNNVKSKQDCFNYAKKLFKKNKYDVIGLGHSHVVEALMRKKDNTIYFNSGESKKKKITEIIVRIILEDDIELSDMVSNNRIVNNKFVNRNRKKSIETLNINTKVSSVSVNQKCYDYDYKKYVNDDHEEIVSKIPT